MPASTPQGRSRYRTLFVSDVHLGCRYAQAERFLEFLEGVHADQIYIVGDFIDGWRLSRRWHWQRAYFQILKRLLQLNAQGTQVFYAPGNHDEFLREFCHDFGMMTVANQFIHTTADGRQFVVLHGDQFDDGAVNSLRRWFQLEDCRFSSKVKVWAKQAVQFISDFEERLVCHAKELECDGVICGHIHVPRIDQLGGVTYCNTGDWVEHCTALVEHESGELELIDWSSQRSQLPHRERRPRTIANDRECEPVVEHVAATVLTQVI